MKSGRALREWIVEDGESDERDRVEFWKRGGMIDQPGQKIDMVVRGSRPVPENELTLLCVCMCCFRAPNASSGVTAEPVQSSFEQVALIP